MENEESNLEEETSEKPEGVLDEDSEIDKFEEEISNIEESNSEEDVLQDNINKINNKKESEIHKNNNSKNSKKKKTNNKSKPIKKQKIINEKKDSKEEQEETNEELNNDKDLVEHAVKAVEHISSETAQEMDENAENENIKKVEAALFIAGRFLTLQELVMLTDINPLMIKEILEKLIEKYNDNSGIEIIEKGEGWKMDVRQEHVSMINKLATGSAEFTKAEQETLAVIAYKQPVKQSVIIKIRGNKSYDHIKHFIDIGLVQAKKAGRTKELKLSDDFFEYFHLQKKGDGSTEIIGIEKNEEDEDININNNESDNKNILEENEQEDKSSKEQIDINKNLEEDEENEEEKEKDEKEVEKESDEGDGEEIESENEEGDEKEDSEEKTAEDEEKRD